MKAPDPRHLDVAAFAQAAGEIGGSEPLERFPRLAEEAAGRPVVQPVAWQAHGRISPDAGLAPWIDLHAEAAVPMTCQRCLERVDVAVTVERSFRFAPDEATAARLDEELEEDVLALSRDFDLHALVEDEVLLALPLVPVHEVCPVPVRTEAADADFDEAAASKPNPFAALAGLKGKPH